MGRRHCEERSDEAIQFRASALWIASPSARNDGCEVGEFIESHRLL
jgi:hypothetical protein